MEDTGSNRNDGRNEVDKDRLIEELREAVRTRDEFVAIAAHELRNPMTPILMQVGLLLAAAKSPNRCRPEVITPQLELLEMAVTEFVRRPTALLDVSRIAAGNVRIELAEVNLSALIRGVVSRTAVAARRARCRLDEELQEGVVGMWDPLALEQVAENLLRTQPSSVLATPSPSFCNPTVNRRSSLFVTRASASPRKTVPAFSSASSRR